MRRANFNDIVAFLDVARKRSRWAPMSASGKGVDDRDRQR
jgi:hypothetical protein